MSRAFLTAPHSRLVIWPIIAEIENCANGTGTLGTSAESAVAVFNAAFAQTEEARDNLASTMAAIQTDLSDALAAIEEEAAAVNFDGFNEAVDAAFKDVGVDFQTIGTNMGTGLSSGISESTGEVTAAATSLVTETNDAARAAAGVHSPSVIWQEIGSNLDAGLVLGIQSGQGDIIGAVTSMGQSVNTIMQTYGMNSSRAFLVYFYQLVSEMSSVMASLQNATIAGMAGLDTNMFIIGNNAVVGMINGIYSRSGDLYAAMYSVTANAIAAARSAAAVHSPSKKTQEIFENVGEGMIVGIESKRQKVAAATESVVNEALVIDPHAIKEMSNAISNAVPDYGSLLGEKSGKRRNAGDTADSPSGKVITNNFEITINTSADQDAREIAALVMDEIQLELEREEGALT